MAFQRLAPGSVVFAFVYSSRSTSSGGVDTDLFSTPEGTDVESKSIESTDENFLGTGIGPTKGPEPEGTNRVFPIVRAGWELVLLLVGTAVTVARFYADQTIGRGE